MPILAPATMHRIGTVDERYQSYNVEMLEVTGGKFWKPYGPELDAILKQPSSSAAPTDNTDTPAGMNPALYQYLPSLDLANGRLRQAPPAYVILQILPLTSSDTYSAPSGPTARPIGRWGASVGAASGAPPENPVANSSKRPAGLAASNGTNATR